jgi:hypothetical protein
VVGVHRAFSRPWPRAEFLASPTGPTIHKASKVHGSKRPKTQPEAKGARTRGEHPPPAIPEAIPEEETVPEEETIPKEEAAV